MRAPLQCNERATAGELKASVRPPEQTVIKGTDECAFSAVLVADDRNEGRWAPTKKLVDVTGLQRLAVWEGHANFIAVGRWIIPPAIVIVLINV
jgi:hypothetical protein